MRKTRVLAAVLVLALLPVGSAAASHEGNGTFEQPVIFRSYVDIWDVLIVPPHHGQLYNSNGALNGADPRELNPLTTSYLEAVEDSVADLQRAINEYGSDALRNGLQLRSYVVGRDEVPAPAVIDPEIVIFADENKAVVLGVAIFPGGSTCLVDNSMMFLRSMTYHDMFNINAQEYAHCLGLDHVLGANVDGPNGDKHDPLNGGYPDTPGQTKHLHCFSNLNIKGVEEVFRPALGTGTGSAPSKVAATDYLRPAACASRD